MNILTKIKKLNFPIDKYVVVGSGILEVLGIRTALDIDIVVTSDLHVKLRETGEWKEEERYGYIFLKKDVFEIIPKLDWEDYKTTTEEAIESAFFIEDVPFMNLEELVKFKTALGREKDFKDIELIKNYLESKNNRVRAIIIEDSKILLMHRIKAGNEYWVFPGGGLEDGDLTPEDGLKRECLEELGVEVEVKGLFMEKPSLAPKTMGKMEYFYKCNIIGGKIGTGTGPEFSNRDIEQYGTYEVVWIHVSDLKGKNVYPYEVRDRVITERISSQ